MIQGELGAILEELGREIGIMGLGPDEHETCLIRLKNGVEIQIEMLKGGEYLLIASDLGEVVPGRYRSDLFEAVLNFNGSDEGGVGTFGFSKRSNHLLLFDRIPMRGLNGMKVADAIGPLSEKALVWNTALQNGEIPRLDVQTPTGSRGIFGLRP